MALTREEFETAFAKLPGHDFGPDEYQWKIIKHDAGPLWVLAGPGAGKTDSAVLRCLKLLVVDGEPPKSIILTTFTEKAARNMQERIARYMQHLVALHPDLASIDYTALRVGTLHSICNDVMQEFRFPKYQNFRLLTDIEQRLFITEYSSLAALPPRDATLPDWQKRQFDVWKQLYYLVDAFDYATEGRWTPAKGAPPTRWMRAKGAQTLFNRIVEERVNVGEMRAAGGAWETVADAYEEYRDALFAAVRCDFAHLQVLFLEFLTSSYVENFLQGNGTEDLPGIRNVIVDEYQDTNPIQEDIYFLLAERGGHNLCVVGDDDQALYRFRGGTVEAMVHFGLACEARWPGVKVTTRPLPTNYRSHPRIVKFCDDYIKEFDVMKLPGARAPGKAKLIPGSDISGDYPAVALMTRKKMKATQSAAKKQTTLSQDFAQMILGLRENGIISDYSQCVLLLHSTKDSPRNAGPYLRALEDVHIPVYNPRSKALLSASDVKAVLGAFLEIVDPQDKKNPDSYQQDKVHGEGIKKLAQSWRDAYFELTAAGSYPELVAYVKRSASAIKSFEAGKTVGANMAEVLYHVLSYEPFSNWTEDASRHDRITRLAVITQIFEAFSAVPRSTGGGRPMGDLTTSSKRQYGISSSWRQAFYYALLSVLASEGVSEPEDDEEDFPEGQMPVMTVHQAKGLEFPFVFVGGLSPDSYRVEPSAAILLEEALRPFVAPRPGRKHSFDRDQKAEQDLIRFFYVAYSRAQNALVLLTTNDQNKRGGIGYGPGDIEWLMERVDPL